MATCTIQSHPVKWICPLWPLMFKLPTVALDTFLCLLFNDEICVGLILFSFPSIILTMQLSNQTFSHLTTHRNWQKQTTHLAFLACPKTWLKWSSETMWYIDMYTPEETFFSGFVFHLVQNVNHKPDPPAAGHLIFADTDNSRSLPHRSVKFREQT